MSTRTTGKRGTLRERVGRRMFVIDEHERGKHMFHVRAELQRVARQVRKLDDSDGGKHKQTVHFACGYYQAVHDVLALLREAQR